MAEIKDKKLAEEVGKILKEISAPIKKEEKDEFFFQIERLFGICVEFPEQAKRIVRVIRQLPEEKRSLALTVAGALGGTERVKLALKIGEEGGVNILHWADNAILQGSVYGDAKAVRLLKEVIIREVRKDEEKLSQVSVLNAPKIKEILESDLNKKGTEAYSDLKKIWEDRESFKKSLKGLSDKERKAKVKKRRDALQKVFRSDRGAYRFFMGQHSSVGSAAVLRGLGDRLP